ncbi:PepSY-associated TM helix domain-containing protein [Photobacterium leiognathi]|uniref:PepSY-associated TM helix domain-containing protein n=1 Tax=Photobacterium leiognathi TaxID=553611 RepID=UPI000769DC10|nr:PepSY domain-containing protein [Photobacterium leiognathi]
MFYAKKIHHWLWRWHIIAGLISLPFILLLSVTGAIYLFKADYEQQTYRSMTQVTPSVSNLTYQQQLDIAQKAAKENGVAIPTKMILPDSDYQATQFIAGRFSSESYTFVDSYTGDVTGQFARKDTLMQKVRKLHGELLLGKKGSWVIELVASWLVVLIITGLYLFFPRSIAESWTLFRIRVKQGKRTFYRDLHALCGFWLSLALLLVLAGGLPWTELFGSNFKTVRDQTGTGYPTGYHGRGLESDPTKAANKLDLDDVVTITKDKDLAGVVTITIPTKPKGIYSISNRAEALKDQQQIHVDQYSGNVIKAFSWSDVGVLSNGRHVVMRIHQGEFFGQANWYFMLGLCVLNAVLSASALVSYCLRKPKKSLGLPKVARDKQIGVLLWGSMLLLGITLPMFGISLLAIMTLCLISKILKKTIRLVSAAS